MGISKESKCHPERTKDLLQAWWKQGSKRPAVRTTTADKKDQVSQQWEQHAVPYQEYENSDKGRVGGMATVEQIRPIVKPTTVKHDNVKIYSANTKSLKGKTEEISNETFDYDIVCLTETHIDNTIQDHQIFDYNNKILYRKDRNIYRGVLIAGSESFTSKQITLANTDNTEILFVRV